MSQKWHFIWIMTTLTFFANCDFIQLYYFDICFNMKIFIENFCKKLSFFWKILSTKKNLKRQWKNCVKNISDSLMMTLNEIWNLTINEWKITDWQSFCICVMKIWCVFQIMTQSEQMFSQNLKKLFFQKILNY